MKRRIINYGLLLTIIIGYLNLSAFRAIAQVSKGDVMLESEGILKTLSKVHIRDLNDSIIFVIWKLDSLAGMGFRDSISAKIEEFITHSLIGKSIFDVYQYLGMFNEINVWDGHVQGCYWIEPIPPIYINKKNKGLKYRDYYGFTLCLLFDNSLMLEDVQGQFR